MVITTVLRCAVVFLIVATTLCSNMDDNLIARLGISTNYGYVMILALACTLLLSARHSLIVAAVALLSLNANMPAEFTLNFGIDRDFYVGLMFALILQPVLGRVLSI